MEYRTIHNSSNFASVPGIGLCTLVAIWLSFCMSGFGVARNVHDLLGSLPCRHLIRSKIVVLHPAFKDKLFPRLDFVKGL